MATVPNAPLRCVVADVLNDQFKKSARTAAWWDQEVVNDALKRIRQRSRTSKAKK